VCRIYDATWGRAFAALYDRELKSTEKNGLARMRTRILAEARGAVLEVGAGTGINLGHYPPTLSRLTLVEPDPYMARRLRTRRARMDREATILEVRGEELPLDDGSFDTAVSTLALCTVREPAMVLSELSRVLKPGGQLLFIEHVRSGDRQLARWQDRLEKPWRLVADGCRCNRDLSATIADSPFELRAIDRGQLPNVPAIIRPMISGRAVLASSP
jgi:SAM-dependent methyltransferase